MLREYQIKICLISVSLPLTLWNNPNHKPPTDIKIIEFNALLFVMNVLPWLAHS